MIDTKGKRITKRQITRSMQLSLVGGGFGAVWFLLVSPQQILTVFVKNYLGASASQLGLFIAAFNIVSVSHIASILFYSRRTSIKPFWLVIGLIHRSLAFVIAFSAWYVAAGGDRSTALSVVTGATLATFFIGSIASSGWWTWIHELVPSQSAGTYFGRRSAAAQLMNIVCFFIAAAALDVFSSRIFIVYGVIYFCAGIIGLMEHILHLPIPEPEAALRKADRSKLDAKTFFSPLRSRTYRSFCLIASFSILAINVANPFFPAYITDPQRIGVPNIWLGIMYGISQLIWVVLVPFWGTLMDRFGRKSITLVGMLCSLSFLVYVFITPENYPVMLIIAAVSWGFFAPALYEGIGQIMFVLLPRKNRTIFIAWFWGLLGLVSSVGPVLGGYLLDITGDIRFVVLTSLALVGASFLLMDNLKIKSERRFSQVFPAITTPTIVKAYYNMPYIARPASPKRVERALRRMSGPSSSLAIEEISLRLDDPDSEIREEAVKALGRIGGAAAEDYLIEQLSDLASTVRAAAAAALGRIASARAVPFLIDGLVSTDESLAEASAKALGSIEDTSGAEALRNLLKSEGSLKVKVSSAEALSKKGEPSVVEDILAIRESAVSSVMIKQLSISAANLLGTPGEFYTYVTGTEEHREEESSKLIKRVYRSLRKLERTDKGFVLHILKDLLPKAVDSFDQGEYDQCFTQLYTTVSNLLYRFTELRGTEAETAEQLRDQLYRIEPHLYAGLMLFHWLDQSRAKGKELTQTDILLCFYFLTYYPRNQKPLK